MKWFRVATEGATTDGRKISRTWIEQMAANYDPAKYGARIWMEHMRGLFADGPFKAFGDVTAVKTEENSEGKLELFVQLNPTDELISMNKTRQKVYTSIEVDPEFADSGEAYLVGLGITDSPASLGTEMLQFSSTSKSNPLASRKLSENNVFTAAIEVELDFSETENEPSDNKSLLASVTALFKRYAGKTKDDHAAFRKDLEATLELMANEHNQLAGRLDAFAQQAQFEELQTAHEELLQRFNDLHARLDNEPDTPTRSTATGGDTIEQTDC